MYAEDFGKRLTQLREQKGVSARDMSLSIGQNAGYINNIENGKNLPSMTGFFYICEYLNVSPDTFFDYENKYPDTLCHLTHKLRKLSQKQLRHITALVDDLIE